MAQQIGRLLLIKIGNGATPQVFSALCGIQTRSFNLSANEVDTTIPDCENPENTPQRTVEPGIKNRTFSGSGKYVKSANTSTFMQHVINGTKFPAQVAVPGLGEFEGDWMASEFELSGEQEGNMDFSATFVAAGPLEFTAEA
jgi:predicted secreted protein